MPKRKAKRVIKRTEEEKHEDDKSNKEKQEDFVYEEVERQMAAIRAIRDVEIEHTETEVKLLRSYFSEEQLDTPALDFLKENLPGLAIEHNQESGAVDLKWKDQNGEFFGGNVDGVDMNYSILKRLSMGFPGFCSRPSLGGYDLPDNVKASLFGTENPQLENLFLQGTSESQMLASHDGLRTPGSLQVTGQRLSYGMTPKTRRQPKPGEMMLSVHGSPLGVYKEDENMEAINEENS